MALFSSTELTVFNTLTLKHNRAHSTGFQRFSLTHVANYESNSFIQNSQEQMSFLFRHSPITSTFVSFFFKAKIGRFLLPYLLHSA